MQKIQAVIMILSLMFSSALPAYAEEEDSLGKLVKDGADEVADEVLFENLAGLAGPSCSLYAVTLNLKNTLFTAGGWSPDVDSFLELSVLFRNASWRELIWALNDQQAAFADQMTVLKKKKCLLGFKSVAAEAKDHSKAEQYDRLQSALDRQITELQKKIDYFGAQRINMRRHYPFFPSTRYDEETNTFFSKPLETDKLFYWLVVDMDDVNWGEYAKEAKRFGRTTFTDMEVLWENVPDTCFAVTHLAQEVFYNFYYFLTPSSEGVWKDSEGNEYKNFREYIEDNSKSMTEHYSDFCRKGDDKIALPKIEDTTSAEDQYEAFIDGLESHQEVLSKNIVVVEETISRLEEKRKKESTLSDDEERSLSDSKKQSAEMLAQIEYYTFVASHVGSPDSESLTQLSKKLSRFVEAVLGQKRDSNGNLQSRFSLSKRREDSKERQLQKICARIESMYLQSGRSLSYMPSIGTANGTTYCQPNPDCENVTLSNVEGVSEGSKSLAECSGFLFEGDELGLSQAAKDVLTARGQDIGSLLEQGAYNDLLKLRNLHYTALRAEYKSLYAAEAFASAELDGILKNVKDNLCGTPKKEGDVNTDSEDICLDSKYHLRDANGNQLSILRRIYYDFNVFVKKKNGSCPAPAKPEE